MSKAVVDVMQMERWSLPMAMAWLIWRTEEAVRAACADVPDTIDAAQPYGAPDLMDLFVRASDPDSASLMDGAEAQTKFWRSMLAGELHATGVPDGKFVRIQIPSEEWTDFNYFPEAARRQSDTIGSNRRICYHGVQVSRAEVLALWTLKGTTPSAITDEAIPRSTTRAKPDRQPPPLWRMIYNIYAEHWPDGNCPPDN